MKKHHSASKSEYRILKDGDDLFSRLDFELITIGHTFKIDPWQYDFCGHPFCRIYYLAEGSFQLSYIDGLFTLKPGHLYLIPASHPFEYIYRGPNEHYWLHFSSLFFNSQPAFNRPLTISEEVLPGIRDRYRAIMKLAGNKGSIAQRFKLRTKSMELLLPFLESIKIQPDYQDSGKLMQAVNYIEQNLSHDIEIATLNKIAEMRQEEFSAAFRAHFGLPPKQYICTRKIDKAKILLLHSKLKIAEIAAECGYDDVYFFCRIFKKYAGATPTQYRKTYFV